MKERLVLKNILIEGVAAEGKAIAHAKLPTEAEDATARVLFVEYAVPGDVVDVLILKRKKNYMEGRVEKIVSPSPHRIKPFCEHFQLCGGCKWQHLPYEMQLEAKTRQVYDQLVRIGHLEVPQVNPTIGSDKTVEYRNKLEFSASDHRWIKAEEEMENLSDKERMGLGFHVGRYFDKVLDINCCHLQKEPQMPSDCL